MPGSSQLFTITITSRPIPSSPHFHVNPKPQGCRAAHYWGMGCASNETFSLDLGITIPLDTEPAWGEIRGTLLVLTTREEHYHC